MQKLEPTGANAGPLVPGGHTSPASPPPLPPVAEPPAPPPGAPPVDDPAAPPVLAPPVFAPPVLAPPVLAPPVAEPSLVVDDEQAPARATEPKCAFRPS